jgi:nitrate reductase NapAB chaperone NapD
MAIAGIILGAQTGALAGLEAAVRGRTGIVDVQRTPADAEIGGLVLVVEQPSDKIQHELGVLGKLPGVEELHLVFANYEDDMDAQGHMECPAHQPRCRKADASAMPFGAGEQE